MKKIIIAAILLFMAPIAAHAQMEGEVVDTLSFNPEIQLDAELEGLTIDGAMPLNVVVKQSTAIRQSLNNHITRNRNKMFNGYRIRIYYDNVQSARAESEREARRFRELYPDMSVYRSFANTYFMVQAGDFRTIIDAEAAMLKISEDFPSAAIVRSKFKYPAM